MFKQFGIKPSEAQRFWYFSLLSLLTTGALFLSKATRDSLFFTYAGPSKLPLAFVVNAITMFFISGQLAKFQERLSIRMQLYVAWGSTLAVVLLFGVFFSQVRLDEIHVIWYFVFFTFCDVPALILITLFWSLADQYFTDQQGQRIYPRLVGSGHLGTVLGGMIAVLLSQIVGTANIIFIWALFIAFSIFTIWRIRSSLKPPQLQYEVSATESEDVSRTGSTLLDGFRTIRKSKYLLLFALITMCTFFLASVFDFMVADTARNQLGLDADALTKYLGCIYVAFGVVAFFIQFIFVPRLLRRLGVANTNLIAPSLLVIAGMSLSIYMFFAAAIARFLYLANEWVFNQTLLPFIYGAVPGKDRPVARATIEGTITNISLGLAGLFLLMPVLLRGFPVYSLGSISLIIALVMLALSMLLRGEYKKIRGQRFNKDDASERNRVLQNIVGSNIEETRVTMANSLVSEVENEAVFAMDLVSQTKDSQYREIIIKRVNDSNKNIRVKAIETLLSIGDIEFDKLRSNLRVGSPRNGKFKYEDYLTLAVAGEAYIVAGRGAELADDYRYLISMKEATADVRALATKLLFKSGMLDGIRAAIEEIDSVMRSDEPSDHEVAAKVLGELGSDNYLDKLLTLVETSKSIDAKLSAIESIRTLRLIRPERAQIASDRMIECLENVELRQEAITTLSSLCAHNSFLVRALRDRFKEAVEENNPRSIVLWAFPEIVAHPSLNFLNDDIDKSLLEAADKGEYHVSRRSLHSLERRMTASSHGRQVSYASAESQLIEKLIKERRRRITLCGVARIKLRDYDTLACQMLHETLKHRCEGLREDLWRLVEIVNSGTGRASEFREAVADLAITDRVTRDNAMSRLELLIENRPKYLMMQRIEEALDFENEDVDKELARLAQECNYDFVVHSLDDLLKDLEEVPDEWLRTLTSFEWERFSASDVMIGLQTAIGSSSFSRVPSELLYSMVQQAESQTFKHGQILMNQGEDCDRFFVLLDGEVRAVEDSEVAGAYSAHTLISELEALAETKMKSPYRFEVVSRDARALVIERTRLHALMMENPIMARSISQALVERILVLNDDLVQVRSREQIQRAVGEHLSIPRSTHVAADTTPTEGKREIERKFVVQINEEELSSRPEVQGRDVEQYYLVAEENVEVRFRDDNGKFILTLKGYGGLIRSEIELLVDKDLYESVKGQHLGCIIQKRRYTYTGHDGLEWEIDVFGNGELQGLVLAEVELEYESQQYEEPDILRIIAEVTEDRVYQNKNLARYGRPPAVFVPELPRYGRHSARNVARH